MIEVKDKKLCCGCQACVQACPRKCISFLMDKEGFFYPKVDKSICIDCHLCEKVCPVNNDEMPKEPQKVIAAYNVNLVERSKSSSGGMFILLAKSIIEENGVVFGAIFDKAWNVKHAYAETLDEIYPMLQSKYVQSNIGDSYIKVKYFLKQGRKVLFCGTPCQVLGLKKFLRKEYVKLFTVDFLCHGVPSPGVWKMYVERELQPLARNETVGKKTGLDLSLNSMSVLSDIEFRNKSYYGWKKYGFIVRGKSASKTDQNTVLLSDDHYANPYMQGFLSDIFLRPSCYDCRYKNGKSGSDLTLGDFWCVEKVDHQIDDDKGLSMILINNMDKFCLDEKKYFQKEFSFEDVKLLNGGFIECHPCNIIRRRLFYLLFQNFTMVQSLKYSLWLGKVVTKGIKVLKLTIALWFKYSKRHKKTML